MKEMTVGKFKEILFHMNKIFNDDYKITLRDGKNRELKLARIIINDPQGSSEDLKFIFNRIE